MAKLRSARRGAMVMVVLVTVLTCALARLGHAAGVELFTPAVELGGNFGYFVCLVFNVSTRTLHGTEGFVSTGDPLLDATVEPWALPPKGIFPHIRQLNDPEVFHAAACHVTSTDAQRGDLLISHCGTNSGLQCQSTVTAH
jgi:hypothetical protein